MTTNLVSFIQIFLKIFLHLDISSSQVLLFTFVCVASGRIFFLDDGGNVDSLVVGWIWDFVAKLDFNFGEFYHFYERGYGILVKIKVSGQYIN